MKSPKKIKATLGVSTDKNHERAENDFYTTSPIATNKAYEWCKKNIGIDNWKVWECACGNGRIAEVLKEKGVNVVAASDLIDRGYGEVSDFFSQEEMKNDANVIFTNPPYNIALDFLKHSYKIMEDGDYYIFLGRIQFLEGKERGKFFADNPPKYVLVHSERVKCYKDDKKEYDSNGKEVSSAVAYAWFLFEKGFKGKTQVDWL